jgi:hypothetical protein
MINASMNRPSAGFLREQYFWSMSRALKVIDLSGKDPDLKNIGMDQLRSAVALQSILLRHGTAYLADEVGMGKTYVALALVTLLRCYKPDLRVLYITSSRNVREKWARRECAAVNMLLDKQHGQHSWAFVPQEVDSISSWIKNFNPLARDTFISYSAFSFQLDDDPTKWAAALDGLIEPDEWRNVSDKSKVKQMAAASVHTHIASHGYDLLVFDEAHLLRSTDSDRARFIKLALLGPDPDAPSPVFRASLLLSATPFDRDIEHLRAQLAVSEPLGGQLWSRTRGLKPTRNENGTHDWSMVQRALKTFMVRRSHALVCADNVARSRNQYRVEHRAAAAIRLREAETGENDEHASARLLQRLYTAVVQKKLVESKEAAAFPLAMFSSWESYTSSRTQRRPEEEAGDVLDVKGDAASGVGELAKDAGVLAELTDSWRKHFSPMEPPHPKLEREAMRIADEAFLGGQKQLVFVRRIRSINDLKMRIGLAYDKWLAHWLEKETSVGRDRWLAYQATRDAILKEIDVSGIPDSRDGRDRPVPASSENLFCWFFRGNNDSDQAKSLAMDSDKPTPERFRTALTDRKGWRSVIGEVDWRALLGPWLLDVADDDFNELAAIASRFDRGTARTVFDTFRYVQLSWLIMRAGTLPADCAAARACERLIAWLTPEQSSEGAADQAPITADDVRKVFSAHTLMKGLSDHGMLGTLWPLCDRLLEEMKDGTAEQSLFAEFDLHREVLFAIIRLDHPFIDLWLSCPAGSANDGLEGANQLIKLFCDRLRAQETHAQPSLSSYGVLSNLAQGWKYLLKTNFADLKSKRLADGTQKEGAERDKWRNLISVRMTARDPIEWASGQNPGSRPDIAWRFRMPGYPMVLVSTSVFQEGEDLHTYCRHVTHFGISGSPIGIEQKNGRVDRVGSQAQRLLCARSEGEYPAAMIEKRGLSIRFPHVTESLEWLQIRDLSKRLNEYQRSMHQLGRIRALDAPSLQDALRDDRGIEEQLTDKLSSPLEPWLEEWQFRE